MESLTAQGWRSSLYKSETWSFKVPLDRIADALSLLTNCKEQPFKRWVKGNGKTLTEREQQNVRKWLQTAPALFITSLTEAQSVFLLIIFDNPDDAMMFKLAF